MDDWQPIEIAPKDESQILCFGSIAAGGRTHSYIAICHYEHGASTFVVSHDFEYWESVGYTPTHWMPLPEAPKVAK
ncbi:uncharacterized protein DUF551 [Maritalea mobilis]|uniref:Uncharacterized protein DUF551 n=1 Tax=Maritalea mobilis TaxID=483324 RepID=A0A4R6VJC3_9HYPH|nr:DUF551 domain-containing protein [Maritalea mobilis]TDQ63598.1 uncharacterized protein DUF551 [Maritalea mobilis]